MNSADILSGPPGNAYECAACPLVSMVIPCYNHAAYVQQSIASIIAQDYQNIELIIIDDGSRDESVLRIKEMAEQCRSRFVRFEFRARPNQGLSATLNEALQWSQGDYFAALASDDELLPQKTSKLVECMRNESGVAGAFGGAEAIDAKGAVIGAYKSLNATCGFEEILLHTVIVYAPSQLLDMQAIRAVGGFPSGIYIEDWYLWLKLTDAGYRLKFIEDTLVRYRQHDANISKNVAKMHESRLEIVSAYQSHPKYGFTVAQIYAAGALEYSETEKCKALGFLATSAKYSPKIMFGFNFVYSCIKIITPKSILDIAKRFAAATRR